ncbi:MAG: hypothetical protein GDA46_04600 [Bdellovibrionales bacterium]|nr:hypothetical protein [Bdellovibrionales bacterium]
MKLFSILFIIFLFKLTKAEIPLPPEVRGNSPHTLDDFGAGGGGIAKPDPQMPLINFMIRSLDFAKDVPEPYLELDDYSLPRYNPLEHGTHLVPEDLGNYLDYNNYKFQQLQPLPYNNKKYYCIKDECYPYEVIEEQILVCEPGLDNFCEVQTIIVRKKK